MSAAKKWRDLSAEELKETYQNLSKDLFRMKNEVALTRKLEHPHKMKLIKRDRARVLTVLREKVKL